MSRKTKAELEQELAVLAALYEQFEEDKNSALRSISEQERALCHDAAREIKFWVGIWRKSGITHERLDWLEDYGKRLAKVGQDDPAR